MKNIKTKLKLALISGIVYGLMLLGFDLLSGEEIDVLKYIISALIFALLMIFIVKIKQKKSKSKNQNT